MPENQASPIVWIAVAFFLVFCALIYTSSWLRGSRWFAIAMLSLAGTLLLLAIDTLRTGLDAKNALGLAIFTWVFGFIFYVIGSRYITRTKLLDLTYQSRDALERYLTENQIHSPLGRVLRAMPLLLVVGMALVVGLGLWAKNMGLLT